MCSGGGIMTIIRGATTVEADTPEEISGAVKELLDEIFRKNRLRKEEADGFLFSLTTDLHSRHPAKAARECGYDFAPLFACTEPETEGSLARCIRVMLFTERPAGSAVFHIYLRGAKVLRKDISEIYNIALDGRDIGSMVLPNAAFKFFITADSRVRAMRRMKELESRGQKVDFEALRKEIELRDKQDSEREFSPLKKAEDAVVIDTSEKGIEEVVAEIKSLIQSKI